MAAHYATDADVEKLGAEGFFCRDGFLDEAEVASLAALAQTLSFKRAGIGRGAAQSIERADEICWLAREQAPRLFDRFEALKHDLRLGLDRFDVQLARYA